MDLPDFPPSFLAQRSRVKCLIEMKCLVFILSQEISDHMYCSS